MKNLSVDTLKDMVIKFLTPDCNINARMLVLEHVLALTVDDHGVELITGSGVLTKIMEVMNAWGPEIRKIICKILVNLSATEDGCRNVMATPFEGNLIHAFLNMIQKNHESADLACMILCNLTRNEDDLELIGADFKPLDDTIPKLLEAFLDVSQRSDGHYLDQIAMLFCNLSRHNEIRKYFMNHDGRFLNSVLPFIEYPDSSVRRQGIVCTIRNCSFVTEEHPWLLKELHILPRLLLPLTGNEDFTDEENDQLPPELQYMPSSKKREPDPAIRKDLIEILNQFCTTAVGRTFLRDQGVYFILREYHKWEKNVRNIFACVSVVDILIRTEDEIGLNNLADDVNIPDDILEQLRKVRIDLGSLPPDE